MGLKRLITVLAIFFILLNIVTAGRLWAFILPNLDVFLGHFFCNAGGMILNPMVDAGFAKISYPVADDFIYVSIPTIFLAGLILKIKKEWRSLKSILLVFLVSFGIFILIEKALGYYFIFLAEKSYGMTGCIDMIQIGGIGIPYSAFAPLHIIGLMLLIAGVIGAVVKLKSKQGGNSGN